MTTTTRTAAPLLKDYILAKKYSYFFTRTDLFKSQQLVQTAHVALDLGVMLTAREANHLFFVNCEAKNLDDIYRIMDICHQYNIEYVKYRDSYFDDEITAIATFPIGEDLRSHFRGENLLKL